MFEIATLADKLAHEAEMPVDERWTARTLYEQLTQTAAAHPTRPAVSFQLRSDPGERAVTLTWAELKDEVTRSANALRNALDVREGDVVAYLLPNCIEAVVTLLAGATAGTVLPVNPLLAPEVIAGILRESGAKVVVTLAPFPKTDLAEKVAHALEEVPSVEHVLEVDLGRYLAGAARLVVPLMRPRRATPVKAKVQSLGRLIAGQGGSALGFREIPERFCTMFHTGGTTGLPKIAQHRARGILYNGWIGRAYMFTERDVLLCPLPMFHVFAAYPVFMSCLVSGAHFVMITPQGYRGEGVFKNFWKLIERWRVTFLITVPTAVAMLMQRKIDADVSTLRLAVSGSAPMPVELFKRFEAATGVKVLEGYGLTEATCLVSVNPPFGERKIGSVGIPFTYTDVRILDFDKDGRTVKACAVGEVGEICVKNPGTTPGETYTDVARNRGLYSDDGYLRTGDLGRIDADGYLWITGRKKDLIIRSGHNIDPGLIEDAMMRHPQVAFVGAIGEPNAHSGEVPVIYVELCDGADVDARGLLAFAREQIGERAAVPRNVEILSELPKTAVGKIFKPDLRKRAIARVYDDALEKAGLAVRVREVVEDRARGLVARLDASGGRESEAAVAEVLGTFVTPWEWAEPPSR